MALGRKEWHRVNFLAFMTVILRAHCPEAETPKANPHSFWPEGVEDIVQRNCRYWKVWDEF